MSGLWVTRSVTQVPSACRGGYSALPGRVPLFGAVLAC